MGPQALPEDESFLRELGVSDVLSRDRDLAELVRERHPKDGDALLHLVNYEPGAYDAVKPGAARLLVHRRRRRRGGADQRDGGTDPREP